MAKQYLILVKVKVLSIESYFDCVFALFVDLCKQMELFCTNSAIVDGQITVETCISPTIPDLRRRSDYVRWKTII